MRHFQNSSEKLYKVAEERIKDLAENFKLKEFEIAEGKVDCYAT